MISRLAVLVAVPLLAVAAPARALEDLCATDADCGGYGLACLAITTGECAESPTGERECETETVHLCGPVTCTSDADCTGGTGCVTFTDVDCEGGCDPDDEECGGGAGGVDCETTVESYCLPPFLAPCEADADCGAGFACVALEECWGEASSSGEYEETCAPTGESRCEYVPVPCDGDADCGTGTTCETLATYACDDEGCEEVSASYCMTPSFLAWTRAMEAYGSSDGAARGGGQEFGGGDAGSGSGGTGCAATGSSAVSLLALLGVSLVLRRR